MESYLKYVERKGVLGSLVTTTLNGMVAGWLDERSRNTAQSGTTSKDDGSNSPDSSDSDEDGSEDTGEQLVGWSNMFMKASHISFPFQTLHGTNMTHLHVLLAPCA